MRDLLLPKMQATAILASNPKLDTNLLLSRYSAIAEAFDRCLPPYLAPDEDLARESKEAFKAKYEANKDKLAEIAKNTKLL